MRYFRLTQRRCWGSYAVSLGQYSERFELSQCNHLQCQAVQARCLGRFVCRQVRSCNPTQQSNTWVVQVLVLRNAGPSSLSLASLQQRLRGCRFRSNEEVEMAVCEWLRMQEPGFYCDGTFPRAKVGQMRQYARRLCGQIMTFQCSKRPAFNVVVTSYFIYMSWGTYFTCYVLLSPLASNHRAAIYSSSLQQDVFPENKKQLIALM
jgi:hypothetical protein